MLPTTVPPGGPQGSWQNSNRVASQGRDSASLNDDAYACDVRAGEHIHDGGGFFNRHETGTRFS